MTDSQKLLADYVDHGSEAAFRELVACYLNFVYSAALRIVHGDTHLAEDISQTVFADLARKARSLSRDVMLGGWLHRHTCFVATTALRTERRRQSREQRAAEMNMLQNQPDSGLAQVAPILDEAIDQLDAGDRSAILLRFFEQREFRAVGEALGSSEDAARMRVNRALEKLHVLLKHRGVTLSAAALGTILAGEALTTAAPAGLFVAVSGAALSAAGSVGVGSHLALLKLFTMTKLQFGLISALLVAGVATPLFLKHQAQVQLRDKDESLRRQTEQLTQLTAENERLSNLLAQAKSVPTPHLPASRVPVAVAPAETNADELHPARLISRWVKDGNAPGLTREQVDTYLEKNHRSVGSLLAAFRATGDKSYLKEAQTRFPNDPQVAFAAAFKSDSPEDQRVWLDHFKQSAPNNSMANYLSALAYFKSGQPDQAVQELSAATAKGQFQDYSMDFLQDAEDAYLAAGYSPAEAKTASAWQLLLPQLAELKQLNQHLVDLAASYRQSGDEPSAQLALQMGANLGLRYNQPGGSPGEALVSQLVGVAIERIALNAMDPSTPYGSDGQTVQDRLAQLAQLNTDLHASSAQVTALLPSMTDADWISYKDRWRSFGEEAAERWLISKYGQK